MNDEVNKKAIETLEAADQLLERCHELNHLILPDHTEVRTQEVLGTAVQALWDAIEKRKPFSFGSMEK